MHCIGVCDTTATYHQYYSHRTRASSYGHLTTATDLIPLWETVINPTQSEALGRNDQLIYEVEKLKITWMHD